MTKYFLLVITAMIFLGAPLAAKDKSLASDYKVVLNVNSKGQVVAVKTESSMPKKLKEKTTQAFINKEIGKRFKDGVAIEYKQKIVVSTKFLIGGSKVSKR